MTVRELSAFAEVVMTWPVNTVERARRLLDWGVHGLTTDRFDAVAGVLGHPQRSACQTS
jgi:glycerophosphoryl diester phosphodiesterase